MANYYATARTNYFRVKNNEAFAEWLESLPSIEMLKDGDRFGFYSDCPDSGDFPSSRWDENANDYVDVDLTTELAHHLAEGEVAILMEVGAEKLRYLNGWATAVNHLGQTVTVDLTDIYQLAETTFGIKPTTAEY